MLPLPDGGVFGKYKGWEGGEEDVEKGEEVTGRGDGEGEEKAGDKKEMKQIEEKKGQ